MTELVGQRLLKRYLVDRFLGRGGMADVYRAWDTIERRRVALKVLREDLRDDPAFPKQFRKEAIILDSLRHRNIVRYYGLEEGSGQVFVVMEYIDGESLQKLLAKLSPLTPEQALALLEPICAALSYAHGQVGHPILHCDLKPANILIERTGRVVLTDFGIARFAESATTTFSGAGSPGYMSPEQVRGSGLTAQSDIYGLGITLYEVLTRTRPFLGDTGPQDSTRPERVRWEHLNSPPASPRSIRADLPPVLDELILDCLAKNPIDRPRSVADLPRRLSEAGLRPDPSIPWSFDFPVEEPHVEPPPIPWWHPSWWYMKVGLALAGLALVTGILAAAGVFPEQAPVATATAAVATQPSPVAPGSAPGVVTSRPATSIPAMIPAASEAPSLTLTPSNVYLQYVLDASNSMMQPLTGGQSKLDVARSALAQHWREMPSTPNTALWAIGNRTSAIKDSEKSCREVDELAPMLQRHSDQIELLVQSLGDVEAVGMAPLNQVIVDASEEYTRYRQGRFAMILIADGGDNCGSDPCKTLAYQREAGVKYPIYVVGLGVDAAGRDALTCLATTSGGQYRDANDAATLRTVLDGFVRTANQ